ncbi:MAG TPA: hypothetical protein VLI92_00585 [Candidatus Saccharimonadales bacterium]|nr:hypothetical protein [Candidatus Saccharimonadales bacterium]
MASYVLAQIAQNSHYALYDALKAIPHVTAVTDINHRRWDLQIALDGNDSEMSAARDTILGRSGHLPPGIVIVSGIRNGKIKKK